MKIRSEDLEAMSAAIAPLDTEAVRANYAAGNFPRADLCKDRDKRYRWDLLHASGFDICGRIYPYANDSHVDTALRSIVAPLEGVPA